MTATARLLPCLFCGGEAHFAASSDGYAVECDGELCLRNAMQEHPSEEYAALWWNTRSITAAAVYGYQAAHGTCRIVKKKFPYSEVPMCSECGRYWLEDSDNFCPSCGRRVVDDCR